MIRSGFKNIVKSTLIERYPKKNYYHKMNYRRHCIKCGKYNCYCFLDFDSDRDYYCYERYGCERHFYETYYCCRDCPFLSHTIKNISKHNQKQEVFMI